MALRRKGLGSRVRELEVESPWGLGRVVHTLPGSPPQPFPPTAGGSGVKGAFLTHSLDSETLAVEGRADRGQGGGRAETGRIDLCSLRGPHDRTSALVSSYLWGCLPPSNPHHTLICFLQVRSVPCRSESSGAWHMPGHSALAGQTQE